MTIENQSFSVTGRLIKHIKEDGIEIYALCTDVSRRNYAFYRIEGSETRLYHCNGKNLFKKVLEFRGGKKLANEIMNREMEKIRNQYLIKKLKKFRPGMTEAIQKLFNSEDFLPMAVWSGIKVDDCYMYE